MIDPELLAILACPVCKAPVREVADGILCTSCTRTYPVKDGIPVMLAEEARIDGKKTKE